MASMESVEPAGPSPVSGTPKSGPPKKVQARPEAGGNLAASQNINKQEETAAMAAQTPKSKPASKPKATLKTKRKATAKTAAAGNGSAAADAAQVSDNGSAETAFSEPTPGGTRTVSSVLGEITWLLTQSPQHKSNFFIGDLEWMVMPAILLEQFRIFYASDRPIGVALWAHVGEDVEKRLEAGGARMAPNDWKSGSQLWLVELIAPFGGQEEMLKDLQVNVFGDEQPKMRKMVV